MSPTEILRAEHRVIEQVLDCLERMAQDCAFQGRLDGDSARKALEFLREFADRCHHGKEEDHLFPAMEARGFPRAGGPTGVMLSEHEQGRALIRGMAGSLEDASAGKSDAVRRFVEHAQGYVELLRQHIEKEDHCLFTMADQAFSEGDQESLLQAFQRVELEHLGAGTHERYLAVADELAERFGMEKGLARGCGCGGGGRACGA